MLTDKFYAIMVHAFNTIFIAKLCLAYNKNTLIDNI
jgi:hypothetical protein